MEMPVTEFAVDAAEAPVVAEPTATPRRKPGRPKRQRLSSNAHSADVIDSAYRDAKVERWLTDHQVEYSLIWLDLGQLNRAESLRNQARHEALDMETVERYEAAMAAGDQFPPIVVYRLGDAMVTIDGNHRVASYDLNEITIVSAYLVQSPTAAQISTLTFEANTKHGRPTSQGERLNQAIKLMADGVPQSEAALILSLSPSSLKHYVERARADQRLQALDVRRFDRLSPSNRVRLATIRNDQVFKAAAQLSIEGGLRGDEIASFVTSINKTRSSERAQLALIQQERDARKGSIKATAGGRVQIPQQIITLMRGMSTIVRLDAKGLNEALAAVPPELRGDLVRQAAASVEVLMGASRLLVNLRDD